MRLVDELREHFIQEYPKEAARIVERDDAPIAGLENLTDDAFTKILENVEPGSLLDLFRSLNSERQIRIIQLMNIRTTMLLLRGHGEEDLAALLGSLPRKIANEYRELLEYPERSAGRYMDKLLAHYRSDQTVQMALNQLRRSKAQRARSLYVVSDDDVLVGRVDLQDMALADGDTPMSALLHTVNEVATLSSNEEDLVALFEKDRVDSIPVVDNEFKLLGIIRYANLIVAAEEAASVGMQRMVGVSADERALSPPLFAVKRRIVWLHVNLLTAFLAASVVGVFESIIAQFTALAILLPVVAGQSGNAGSQSLAVTMRGLALREVSTLQWRAVMNKEIVIGIVNGVALAATCGLGVLVWSRSWGLALVIAIAMFTAMIMAGISGALVPMILARLGQDPAMASSIILTTVTDIAGFTVFLGTATLLATLL